MRYVTLLVVFLAGKDIISGNINYTQEELERSAGGIGNYSSILFVVVYFALLSLSVYNCKLLKLNRLKDFINQIGLQSLICLGFYIVTLLIIGSRSNIVVILVSLLFAVLYVCNKRLGLFYIIIGVMCFAYVMSFIGITRRYQGMSMAEKTKLVESVSLEKKNIMPTTLDWQEVCRHLMHHLIMFQKIMIFCMEVFM